MVAAFMILAIAACNGGGGNGNGSENTAAVPKGNRVLEIQSSEPADGDFAGAFNLAQTVGMESASLAQDWNDIDIGTDNSTVPPSPIYADDPDTDFLTIANSCYPISNTKLSLLLRPIPTLTKMAPPGFENVPFDDPAMIERFKAFLDHAFSKIPDLEITALAIGSEVDLYLLTTDLQDEYLSFYEAVSEYARAAYTQLYPAKPLLNVAVEVTHKGLLDPGSRAYYQQLNTFSDVIGVSYYPLDNGVV